jgi:MFS superfamily sulfate permease-like transporter
MLQINNVVFGFLMIVAAWCWQRVGFRAPQFLRLRPQVARRLLRVAGVALIVWIIAISLAAFPARRTQISKTEPHYAWLDRDPARFYRELILQTLLVGTVGVAFMLFSKRSVLEHRKAETPP